MGWIRVETVYRNLDEKRGVKLQRRRRAGHRRRSGEHVLPSLGDREDPTERLTCSYRCPDSPTMPAGYTYKRLLSGVANDASSNIAAFVQLADGRIMFTVVQSDNTRGVSVLSNGTSTSYAAIDLSKAIPDVAGCAFGFQVRGTNTNATNSVFSCAEDSARDGPVIPGQNDQQ